MSIFGLVINIEVLLISMSTSFISASICYSLSRRYKENIRKLSDKDTSLRR
jgi:hypothetical protein